MTLLKNLMLSGAAVLALTQAATAAEIEVKMLNKGTDGQAMVFEPAFIKAQPGDVVRFIPTDKSHNVEMMKDMTPAGVEVLKGKINQEFDVPVTEAGLYGIKCTPHFAMGMVALIQVGDGPFDPEPLKAVKVPKKAGERFAPLFDQVTK